MKIEKTVEDARKNLRPNPHALPTPSIDKSQMHGMLGPDDFESMLERERSNRFELKPNLLFSESPDLSQSGKGSRDQSPMGSRFADRRTPSPSFVRRFSAWFGGIPARATPDKLRPRVAQLQREESRDLGRRGSVIEEITRQTSVFFADPESESEKEDEGEEDDVAPYGGPQRDWRDYGEGDTTASEDEADAYINGSRKSKTL